MQHAFRCCLVVGKVGVFAVAAIVCSCGWETLEDRSAGQLRLDALRDSFVAAYDPPSDKYLLDVFFDPAMVRAPLALMENIQLVHDDVEWGNRGQIAQIMRTVFDITAELDGLLVVRKSYWVDASSRTPLLSSVGRNTLKNDQRYVQDARFLSAVRDVLLLQTAQLKEYQPAPYCYRDDASGDLICEASGGGWGTSACGGINLSRSLLLRTASDRYQWAAEGSVSSVDQLQRLPGQLAYQQLDSALQCLFNQKCND